MDQNKLEIVPDLASLKLRLKTLEIQILNQKKVSSLARVQTLDDFFSESFWDRTYAGKQRQQTKFLLNQNQEEFLWMTLVKENSKCELGHAFELGVKARQAFNLATNIFYDIKYSGQLNEDQKNFHHLCNQYQSFLKDNKLVDTNLLLHDFPIYLNGRKFQILGFNLPLPLEKKIISLAEPSDSNFTRQCDYSLYLFPSFDDEIREAFLWADGLIKKRLESRIAIVVDKQDIEYATIIGKHMKMNFYSLAAQEKISKQSMVRLPLELFKLDHIFTWEHLSYLLTNRNLFGVNKEINSRSIIDAEFRASGIYQMSLEDLLSNKKLLHSCPLFIKFLKRFKQFLNQRQGSKKISLWVQLVNDFLQDIDWLSDRASNSLQEKVFQSWSSVCDSLCSLDALGAGEISFYDFSYYLTRKLEVVEIRYAVESSNLFVLDPDQVSSVQPTHLWLIGMCNGKPRLKNQFSNFLPLEPQIKAMVSGIDPTVDFQLRQKLFDSFLVNKQEIIISYSEYTRGVKNLKSTFIDSEPVIPKSHELTKTEKVLIRSVDYENLYGARSKTGKQSYRSVSFFADQAACPFKGYAIHRLDSKAIEEPSPGIDKKLQGVLVHDVLANFWADIKSSENLKSKNIDGLAQIIMINVESVFKKSKNLVNCEAPIIDIEKNRIKKLILNWLEFEKKGEDFKVVGIEKKVNGKVFDSPVSCRLDRLDRLADGSLRVVDYKTGTFIKGDLEPPRINAPQLYLYSILVGLDKVKSFSVAKVHQKTASVISKILQANDNKSWHEDLVNLNQEINNGFAARIPKKPEATCNFCDQKLFCRIKTFENSKK
ncbi:MAG: PD-(D/E)XK nuclease family protein [Pseudomonadota bacterium]|nr:PD-(D/E)XK nuclease family protein [Pseudomonadota bacterium]